MVRRDEQMPYRMAPDFGRRCGYAHGWPYDHLPYKRYVAGAPSPTTDPAPWSRPSEHG